MRTRLRYLWIILGQGLLRMTVSFVLCYALLWHLPTPQNDHHRDIQITPGIPTSREGVSVLQQEVDNDLGTLKQGLIDPEHNAALEATPQKLNELCTIYSTFCKKTSRDGKYTLAEKYQFQAMMIALIQSLDERLTNGNPLAQVLSVLKFYQNDTDRRGSSGHSNVKINTKKIPAPRELREVMTHELGHITDLGALQGASRAKDKNFTEFGKIIWPIDDPSLAFYEYSRKNETTRKATAGFKDFVSGYAMRDMYEDFAESQNMRFNHRDLFAVLATKNPILQKKYKFFENLFDDHYFDADSTTARSTDTNIRVRDTTKIK